MRGEIWTVLSAGYASKPRPCVVVQADAIKGFESTVICLFTSDEGIGGPTRIRVEPSARNGLSRPCFIMAEKPLAVKVSALGQRLGCLEENYLEEISAALRSVLGL